MNSERILLSAQRALLFNIIDCVRFIFIQKEQNKLLMHVYSDRLLSEQEKDIYYSVGGEICGDFTELIDSNVKFYSGNTEYDNIQKLEFLIYARYEAKIP